jgi:predicted kinase
MDLEARGYPALAAGFTAAYAAATGDADVATLLPFYGCHRAAVRGKVEGLQAAAADAPAATREEAAARAWRHFALALRLAWRAGGPAVIAVAGLSGTGKSALADTLADATGFTRLATDVLRGPAVRAAYGDGAYSPAARAAVYDRLIDETERRLAGGVGVVADATFLRAADRGRLAAAAHRERRPIVFVECRAPADVVRARMEARAAAGSSSDARWDTWVAQRSAWEPFAADEPHVTVDTGGALAAARRAALTALWPWRQGRRLRSPETNIPMEGRTGASGGRQMS